MTDVATGFVCEFCEREFATEHGAATHERFWCSDNPDSNKSRGQPVGRTKFKVATPQADESVFDQGPATAETPPVTPFDEAPPAEPAKRSWKEKLWGDAADKPAAPKTLERAPRRRRKSTEGIWQLLWTGVGRGLIYTRADIPVGNVMSFQGPVVGPILDKAIAGTFVDTLLQPLAGAGERFEDVSDVVALPALIGIMERAPQLAPALEPLVRKAIRRHLVEYARMAKAQKKADAEYAKALEDLGMAPEGNDPVDGILAQIWAGVETPAESNNGHVAGADVRP